MPYNKANFQTDKHIMTVSYSALEQLLAMDFSQMRGLKVKESHIATDEAFTAFITGLHDFFRQFNADTPITREQRDKYKEIMQRLTDSINDAESNYFTQKHQDEGLSKEQSDAITPFYALQSYADIPKRMQYWAAPHGETVRTPQIYVFVVRKMAEWSNERCAGKGMSSLFSEQEDSSEHLAPSALPKRLPF